MAGDFITADSLTGLIGDTKINKPSLGAATEQWQLDAIADYNKLRGCVIKGREHRRGAVDADGKAFVGVGQVAADYDPFNANADGLGTTRAALMNVAGVPRWRRYADSAGARMLHDQGVGVFQLPTLAAAPAVAPAGEARFYYDSALSKWRQSVNTGAWADMAGGGGIAAGDNVTWTGTHDFTGPVTITGDPSITGDLNLGGALLMDAASTISVGANELVNASDKLVGAHLSFPSQAAGDSIYFNGTSWVRIPAGAAGTVLAGGTTPAFTATPTVTSLTTGNGSAGSPAVVIGDAGGLYRIADNRIGVAPNGALTHEFAETYFALQTAVSMYFGAPGTTTVPGATWLGDQNTGFSNHTADQVGVILGGTERMLFRAPSSVGRIECDEFRAKNGQDIFFIRATGKAIFGSETSGNILELQSYRATGATTNAFQLWAFAGTATAGNLLSVGDGGSYAQKFGVDFAGRCDFPSAITQTTVGGAGAASALPGAPTGYLHVRIGGSSGSPGTIKLVPYWDWDGP